MGISSNHWIEQPILHQRMALSRNNSGSNSRSDHSTRYRFLEFSQRSLALTAGKARFILSRHTSTLTGIESISKTIADEVNAERYRNDEKSGPPEEPWPYCKSILIVADQKPQRYIRWNYTKSKIAKSCLKQYGTLHK